MILAAGRGERMRPLTDSMPKPLIPVADKPLIVWHLERLAQAGIREVVINHAWLGDMLASRLGDGSAFGLRIRYSAETHALETAGGIATALPQLGSEPFLVINGDIWCDWDPAQAIEIAGQLKNKAELGWLLMVPNPTHHPEGDFVLQASGKICTPERTPAQPPASRQTFAGIGIYQPALFAQTRAGQPAKLAPLLRTAMERNLISGSLHAGKWVDVGTPERLEDLERYIKHVMLQT